MGCTSSKTNGNKKKEPNFGAPVNVPSGELSVVTGDQSYALQKPTKPTKPKVNISPQKPDKSHIKTSNASVASTILVNQRLSVKHVPEVDEFRHQRFLIQMENNTLNIDSITAYVTLHPDALKAEDSFGNTAVRFASMNRNLPAFRLLTKWGSSSVAGDGEMSSEKVVQRFEEAASLPSSLPSSPERK